MQTAWIGGLFGLVLAYGANAQSTIPPGTLIPVSLSGSLNLKKVHAGQQFHAEVMQDIPGTSVKRRENLVGHVLSLSSNQSGHARLEITFDAVESHRRRIPIKADLRALGSFNEVQLAQVSEEGASRGITPEVATTTQIGGEQVYRGGGPVADGNTVVGEPTAWGVVGMPRTQPGMPCRGAVGENNQSEAFWLFSTNACGVYGFPNLRIEHSGRTEPVGTVILASSDDKLDLGAGTAMLLRVLE